MVGGALLDRDLGRAQRAHRPGAPSRRSRGGITPRSSGAARRVWGAIRRNTGSPTLHDAPREGDVREDIRTRLAVLARR